MAPVRPPRLEGLQRIQKFEEVCVKCVSHSVYAHYKPVEVKFHPEIEIEEHVNTLLSAAQKSVQIAYYVIDTF